jgi:hypothetical protein
VASLEHEYNLGCCLLWIYCCPVGPAGCSALGDYHCHQAQAAAGPQWCPQVSSLSHHPWPAAGQLDPGSVNGRVGTCSCCRIAEDGSISSAAGACSAYALLDGMCACTR